MPPTFFIYIAKEFLKFSIRILFIGGLIGLIVYCLCNFIIFPLLVIPIKVSLLYTILISSIGVLLRDFITNAP